MISRMLVKLSCKTTFCECFLKEKKISMFLKGLVAEVFHILHSMFMFSMLKRHILKTFLNSKLFKKFIKLINSTFYVFLKLYELIVVLNT